MALGAFEKYKIEEESEGKVLILISSVAVWKNTEPKLVEVKPDLPPEAEGEGEEAKKEGEGEEDKKEGEGEEEKDIEKDDKKAEGDNPQGEGEEVEGEGKEGEGEGEKEELPPPEFRNEPYTEIEYSMRNPPEEYEKIKELEDKILEMNKQGLKTYVV